MWLHPVKDLPEQGELKTTPPTEWIPPHQLLFQNFKGFKNSLDSEELEAAVDDDDQSTATIGSMEEEQFAGEEQTLRRSNRNRRQVERFMINMP